MCILYVAILTMESLERRPFLVLLFLLFYMDTVIEYGVVYCSWLDCTFQAFTLSIYHQINLIMFIMLCTYFAELLYFNKL